MRRRAASPPRCARAWPTESTARSSPPPLSDHTVWILTKCQGRFNLQNELAIKRISGQSNSMKKTFKLCLNSYLVGCSILPDRPPTAMLWGARITIAGFTSQTLVGFIIVSAAFKGTGATVKYSPLQSAFPTKGRTQRNIRHSNITVAPARYQPGPYQIIHPVPSGSVVADPVTGLSGDPTTVAMI